jgi:hypothetical protein
VLAVKGNQESLFNALIGCFFGATERERIEQLMPDCTVRTIEKDHGRIEERRYWLVNDMLKRVDCSAWHGLPADRHGRVDPPYRCRRAQRAAPLLHHVRVVLGPRVRSYRA